MPEKLAPSCKVHYWYGSAEEKDRKWDIRYFKEVLPQTVFEKFDGMGHASMASLYPELFAERLRSVIAECKSGQQA